jgi:hypothetical protein
VVNSDGEHVAMVDKRSEPQRIEVELTSHAPATGRRATAIRALPVEPTSGAAGDDERPVRSDSDDRRRLVVTGLVAGAVALLLGWILGRAGGDPDVATTGSSNPAESSIPSSSPLAGDTLPVAVITVPPPPSVPRTTVPRPPTTTIPTSVMVVEVDPALFGTGLQVVGVGQSGRLVELDLDSGTMVSSRFARVGQQSVGGGATVFAGDNWVMGLNAESGTTTVRIGDGEPEQTTISSWQLWWAAGNETLWRIDDTVSPLTAREIAPDGTYIGPTFDLPGYPTQADPAGGVVIELPGGTFTVDPAGGELLTTGRLVAIGTDLILAVRCDETLTCGLYRTNRTTGEESRLPVELPSADGFQSVSWWGGGQMPIAPDGGAAPVIQFDQTRGMPMLNLIDMSTGELTPLASLDNVASIAWSSDGRFAFYLENSRLFAYDRQEGTSIRVSTSLPTMTSMTVRSSAT